MARLEINRSGEMDVFVRVIELGGFSAAARKFRMTPSAVSKLIARLETRLGTRLVNRSTRKLQLTPEGCAFYERATRILADLDEAERHLLDRSDSPIADEVRVLHEGVEPRHPLGCELDRVGRQVERPVQPPQCAGAGGDDDQQHADQRDLQEFQAGPPALR